MILSKHSEKLGNRSSWKDSHGVRHIGVVDQDYGLDCVEVSLLGAKRPQQNLENPTNDVRKRRAPPTVNIERSRWLSVKARAAKKGLDMNITEEFIKHTISLPCVYCGANKKLSELDRKDSFKGYTYDNVVPACRRCNTIKNNVVTYEEMRFIANYLGWGYS